MKKTLSILLVLVTAYLTGCASVPMAPAEEDLAKKQFISPTNGNAGLYIYRNSTFGGALKKNIYVDGELIGESAPMTYFYKEVEPGEHMLGTESEFSENSLKVNVEGGTLYYIRQFIKFGVFVGGAGLKLVTETIGQAGVLESKLAKEGVVPQ